MELHIVEGNRQKLDGGAMFGNAPKGMWSHWIAPDDQNRIPLATRCLLIKGQENVLFETGVGAFFEPKLAMRFGIEEQEHCLLKNLEKLELHHEDIHHVMLSHLHFDHVGGLVSAWNDGDLRLLFPNATIHTGRQQWEHARKPHKRDKASYVPLILELIRESGRLNLIDNLEDSSLPFVKRLYTVSGHTPGQLLSEIEFRSRPLIFVGDLIPGVHWVHVPITMGYDRFPELTVDEKLAFLDDAHKREALLFFTHDPEVAIASLKLENGRYKAHPETSIP